MLQKIKFYSSTTVVYVLTLGIIGMLLYSSHLIESDAGALQTKQTTRQPALTIPTAISGTPNRITIPAYGIDLPVGLGHYDASTKQWTLSETSAYYATMTAPANNSTGTTFIYGHGTDAVFGKIGSNQPPTGTIAELRTTNGHVFRYTMINIANLKPNETGILSDPVSGSPQLIIQTCTGPFGEWRTMFVFAFKEIA